MIELRNELTLTDVSGDTAVFRSVPVEETEDPSENAVLATVKVEDGNIVYIGREDLSELRLFLEEIAEADRGTAA